MHPVVVEADTLRFVCVQMFGACVLSLGGSPFSSKQTQKKKKKNPGYNDDEGNENEKALKLRLSKKQPQNAPSTCLIAPAPSWGRLG